MRALPVERDRQADNLHLAAGQGARVRPGRDDQPVAVVVADTFEAAREAPPDSPLREFYVWRSPTP